jgi:uncharacterized protein (DUF305 family)
MNKTVPLAAFTALLFACNNNADSTANTDTSNHAAHHNTTADAKNEKTANPIQATMDKMMHEMHNIKSTGNNDIDFAAMMLEHHKGAVDMSQVEVNQGNNAELKAFAQKVIDDQNKEITFMQAFISKPSKTVSANSVEFQKALDNSMMSMMNSKTTTYNNRDKDFAAQMIPHHQSAVDMAKAYLQYGEEASLKTLCQNILKSQTKEINWLKDWLAKNEK